MFFPGNRLEAYEPFLRDPIVGIKKLVKR
jgi:hypothetical protein